MGLNHDDPTLAGDAMKNFSKADNEMLHRVYETYFGRVGIGRKAAGDLSRYIRKLEKDLRAAKAAALKAAKGIK